MKRAIPISNVNASGLLLQTTGSSRDIKPGMALGIANQVLSNENVDNQQKKNAVTDSKIEQDFIEVSVMSKMESNNNANSELSSFDVNSEQNNPEEGFTLDSDVSDKDSPSQTDKLDFNAVLTTNNGDDHQSKSIHLETGSIKDNNVSNKDILNQTDKKSKRTLVDEIFQPNSEGISQWVSRESLSNTKLALGTNGNQRHGIFFSDNRYIWEATRGLQRKVIALRTNGFQDNKLIHKSWPIRKDIRDYHKKNACVACGQTSDLVCDHKNDLYNDPRVQSMKTQTRDDFQCFCNGCNLRKRQVAIVRNKTRKRIGATSIPSMAVFGIDFVEGDDTYDEKDVNAMVGTYWYDPIAFNKKIKELLTNVNFN